LTENRRFLNRFNGFVSNKLVVVGLGLKKNMLVIDSMAFADNISRKIPENTIRRLKHWKKSVLHWEENVRFLFRKKEGVFRLSVKALLTGLTGRSMLLNPCRN